MHQPPHPTPPTQPLPQRSSRTPFYVTVGCLSVIAGLVLGVGGFFGVRVLEGGGGTTVVENGRGDGDGDGAQPTPAALEETPVGPASAVPLGSSFPLRSSAFDADVEVTSAAVDWDASAAIMEANSFNAEPEEGNKYVLLTIEGVHRGSSDVSDTYVSWIRTAYVAEDGTEHERAFAVTPHYSELVEQEGVEAGGAFLSEIPFELPEETEGGGHFVLHHDGQTREEGVWLSAS